MKETTETLKEVYIQDVYLPMGNLKINGIRLRKFQEELYYALDSYNEICLQAPTGSGKTFSIFIMLAKLALQGDTRPVVGIYPSRILVHDQGEQVRNTLEKAGFVSTKVNEHVFKFSGEINVEGIGRSGKIDLMLVELTSETKEDVMRELKNYKPTPPDRFLIVLTVPEYPYLYLSHLRNVPYFGKILEYVVKGNTYFSYEDESKIKDTFNKFSEWFNGYFFIDEYHLYSGLSRASLFTLKRMIDDYNKPSNVKPKFVFSSATPSEIKCEKIITAQTSNEGDKIRKRTALIFHLIEKDYRKGKNPQQSLVDYVSNFQFNKRTMIILDRVYYIEQLCQKIEAGLVWGLNISYGSCKKIKKITNENVIVGNNAISFGVDVKDLDLGFVHAHDAETAIQRIGRFGRHGNGEAEVHIFLEAEKDIVDNLNGYANKEISFGDFLKLIESLYERREDDKLDKIPFSMQRSEILYNAYKILKYFSKGEIYYKNGKFYEMNGEEVKPLNFRFQIRPSAEEYFNVFAFRPGGLKGKWCEDEEDKEKEDKTEEDNFFTMLRNFKYDDKRKCFRKKPSKQNPEVVIENVPPIEFMHFKVFDRISNPKIVINEMRIALSEIKGFENSYVIAIRREKMEELWGKEKANEMARLISTYENTLTACISENFDQQKLRCRKIDALLLFI